MRRRSLAITLVAVVATLGLAAPQLASSAPSGGDPRAERERVRAERAAVAAQIDTSKASLGEIDAALQVLDENLRTQQAALTRTEEAVAQAEQDLADATKAIDRLTEQVAVLEDLMRERAVQAYVSPPGDDVLTVLDTNDFTTASSRKFYIELRAQDDADLADRLEGASNDLAYQKRKATDAKATAEAKRAEQQKRTESVAQAQDQQRQLADNLESQIDSELARSIELAKTDRALSAQIAQQQAAIVARIAAQQAAAEEDARRQAAASSAAAAAAAAAPRPTTPAAPSQPSNQDSGGGETAPLPPVSSGGGGTGTGGIALCTVGGITVNCQIRGQVEALLNAARASGVSLSGGGYRSPAGQIERRQANCGTSYYAIYEMPASSCRPPTAKPGSSQHEVGLAIDFSNCSRSSACFSWLRANAASYGFYNLPSESWHWSTTGN